MRLARSVVIDTFPAVGVGLSRVLHACGVPVAAHTSDPGEGIALVRQHRPALVLCGYDAETTAGLVRQLKAGETGDPRDSRRDPPVIAALVGTAPRDELAALLTAGVDGLFTRVLGPHYLASVVPLLLAGERVVCPTLLPALGGTEWARSLPGLRRSA